MTQLMYFSTRGKSKPVTASEAIRKGIADDGGLFVPARIPALITPLSELAKLDYRELAWQVLRLYLTDFTDEELRHAIAGAYDDKFDTTEIAPLIESAGVGFLELFHGPTLAFKDMALSILPYLMKMAVQKDGQSKEVVILTATSGDTGKAALEGFAGVPGTRIIVFFPEHGVSIVQKRQMVTQSGENTYVVGIEGNFDDAQNGVKAMFTNRSLVEAMDSKGFVFSSANSINIGRLIPQIVYYYHAYLRAMVKGVIRPGEPLNFAVPTGNFGNILAGYYAKRMGLPVGKLICGSNKNKVLYDFFATGIYDKEREFHVTMSPSMDILISSNLERLIWHIGGESADAVAARMAKLSSDGKYEITQTMRENLDSFIGGYATEEETAAAIRNVFASDNYLMDPHTAVAYSVYQAYREQAGDKVPAVVVSTASPYKFTTAVMKAVDPRYADKDDFALFAEMEKLTGVSVPTAVKVLETRPVLHKRVCDTNEMQQIVENILGL